MDIWGCSAVVLLISELIIEDFCLKRISEAGIQHLCASSGSYSSRTFQLSSKYALLLQAFSAISESHFALEVDPKRWGINSSQKQLSNNDWSWCINTPAPSQLQWDHSAACAYTISQTFPMDWAAIATVVASSLRHTLLAFWGGVWTKTACLLSMVVMATSTPEWDVAKQRWCFTSLVARDKYLLYKLSSYIWLLLYRTLGPVTWLAGCWLG